jgi:hypothetical protein
MEGVWMILTKKLTRLIIPLLLISALLSFNPVNAASPTDINNHWAQDYILNMLQKDIMETYSDNKFKPNNNITRGEFSTALSRQLNLLPVNKNNFTDLSNHPGAGKINSLAQEGILSGYPDKTFKPNKTISRAEVISILIKSLGIKKEEFTIYLKEYKPFKDVANKHWASNYIKIAEKLNIPTNNPDNTFQPKQPVSRAEAAKFLAQLNDLSGNTGYITDIYPTSNKISVNLLNGERKVFNITDNTLVGRNNRIVNIDDILKTDKVFIITENNSAEYLKAYGMVTQQDLTTEVSEMTQGILKPDEVNNLANGNLSILKPKLITEVKEQLINQGLTEKEVNAIMNTKWSRLENLSKSRLAEAVAIQTGLPLDITKGVLNGDWEKIKTYAQIEVVQRVIQQMLNSELIS